MAGFDNICAIFISWAYSVLLHNLQSARPIFYCAVIPAGWKHVSGCRNARPLLRTIEEHLQAVLSVDVATRGNCGGRMSVISCL